MAKWNLMGRITMWRHFILNMFIVYILNHLLLWIRDNVVEFWIVNSFLRWCSYWSMLYPSPKGDAKTARGCSADWESQHDVSRERHPWHCSHGIGASRKVSMLEPSQSLHRSHCLCVLIKSFEKQVLSFSCKLNFLV